MRNTCKLLEDVFGSCWSVIEEGEVESDQSRFVCERDQRLRFRIFVIISKISDSFQDLVKLVDIKISEETTIDQSLWMSTQFETSYDTKIVEATLQSEKYVRIRLISHINNGTIWSDKLKQSVGMKTTITFLMSVQILPHIQVHCRWRDLVDLISKNNRHRV